jgi:hypothetical protein
MAASVISSDASPSVSSPFVASEIENRGTGLLAATNFKVGATVFCTTPECSVLYTSFCKTNCAKCFVCITTDNVDDDKWACDRCNSYVLCSSCACVESSKVWHHDGECGAFIAVNPGMRQGDTDYLRWMLRYFDIRRRGLPSPSPTSSSSSSSSLLSSKEDSNEDSCLSAELAASLKVSNQNSCSSLHVDPFAALVTNETDQIDSFKKWARQFASLFVAHASPPPGIGVEEVYLTICRIKVNALGFPFHDDVALGWCLDATAAKLNHSCKPNCAVICNIPRNSLPGVVGDGDNVDGGGSILGLGQLEIKCIADIKTGDELSISYVDLTSPNMNDVLHRREHLKSEYLFDCQCKRCLDELEFVVKEKK